MSFFDKKRLGNETFKLDIDRMRKGWYTDKYFTNITIMLENLADAKELFSGSKQEFLTT
jgi:nicotinate phosphoribosyltransferase